MVLCRLLVVINPNWLCETIETIHLKYFHILCEMKIYIGISFTRLIYCIKSLNISLTFEVRSKKLNFKNVDMLVYHVEENI